MKFNTALKFLVAFEALRVVYIRFGVRAQSVVVDRTSENNGDSVGRFSLNGINNLHVVVDPVTRDMHNTVADAAASDVVLETLPVDSVGRFSPNGINNNLRVVGDPVSGDGSSSKTGTMHHTVANGAASDVVLESLPVDSVGRFSPNGINNLRVVADPVSGDGSSSKTGTMHHTVADAVVSDVLLESLPTDSGGHLFPSGINNLRVVVHPVTRGDRSFTTTATMHHTVADEASSDFKLVTGSSSTTGTMHHTVASDVLLETFPVDSGGRFSSNGMDVLASDDLQQSKQDLSAVISDVSIIFDAMNDDDGISFFTSTDGDAVSTQRKLSKSSKKVKHPDALCTLSLFADSVFMYGNQCFNDIMVTISACDDKDDTCHISERLPSLPEEDQEEEQCFVGGSFPAKQNIRYNPSTGDCEFLYVDLMDDSCNMYTDDDGTGSLGLKARINVKTNLDVMFIQFTKDMGLSFYNFDEERVAVRSTTPKNRYLRQEGETKPLLSMDPHPRRRRRMTDCGETVPFFAFFRFRHPKAEGLVLVPPKKCGHCYGAAGGAGSDYECCNTCKEVGHAYARLGWEHWNICVRTTNIQLQKDRDDYGTGCKPHTDIVQCYDYRSEYKHPECAKGQNDNEWYGRSNCMNNNFGYGWNFNVQTCYKVKHDPRYPLVQPNQHCWSNSAQIDTYKPGKGYAVAGCHPFPFLDPTVGFLDWECVPDGDYLSGCGPRCLEFI